MTNDSLSALKKLYGGSGLPCAIADGDLRVIWRNLLAEKSPDPLSENDISHIFRGGEPVCGIVCFQRDSSVHRFNVMKWLCPENKQLLYIVEHLGCDDLGSLLASPPIKAYMTYLCGRIRRSMGMIAVTADEVDSAAALFGAGCGNVTEQLNTINKELMLVFREVIEPEQLYCMIDPDCEDTTISVPDELKAASDDAKRALGKAVKVQFSSERSVFAYMNRGAFETVAANMTAECCAGDRFPDELIFSCESVGAERAAVTIKSLRAPGGKNGNPVPKPQSSGGKLYYDYLCQVMCDKYDAVFTRQEIPDGYMCRMEFRAINSCRKIVFASPRAPFRAARFNTMALVLADRHLEDRYGFVDIDEETE